MRLGTYVGILSVVLGLSACMKKSRLRGFQPEVTEFNFSDPSVASVDCPNGISLGLIPVTQTHRVQNSSNFIVTASGCKNGYSVTYGTTTTPFGRATTNLTQVFTSSPVRVDFTQPGVQRVAVKVNVLNSNTLSPQIVRVLEVSASVLVEAALPVTCQVSPSSLVIPAGQQQSQRFTITTSVPAKLVGISNAATGGPLVSAPDLSNETIPLVSTPIEKEVTLMGNNGAVNFVVQDASSPAVQSQPCSVTVSGINSSTQGVNADFDGDGNSNDVASLFKYPGNATYQLQISYVRAGESISNSIITSNLPATETYEQVLAGDINADGKADLIFYRKEGSPLVGKFRAALSSGGTGNADTTFNFIELIGFWPNNLLLEDRRLDLTSNPPRILGKIGGQSYASNLENIRVAGQASVGNPTLLVLNANLTSDPVSPVDSGTRVRIKLQAAGFYSCELRSCMPKSADVCDNDSLLSTLSPDNPQTELTTEVGALTQTTQFFSRCFKPLDSTPVRNEITVTVNNPIPSAPQSSYSESFDGVDGAFTSSAFTAQMGSFTRTANAISSPVNTTSILTYNALSEANVRVEADVNVVTSGAVSLVARYQGPQDKNMYLASIYAGYGRIYKNVNGTWTELGNSALSSKVGRLVFEVVGNQLVLSFNGQYVVSVVDNSITAAGATGIRSTAKAGSTFDNFKVSKIEVPVGRVVALPYTDNFEATDGLFLSESFTQQLGRIYRVGGKVKSVDSVVSILNLNGLTAQNVQVTAQVENVSVNGTSAELLARYTGSGDRNAYMGRLIRRSSKTHGEIWVNQGGTWTKLEGKEVSGTGGKLSLKVRSNQISLYFNDNLLLSVSDSTISSGGSVGLRFAGSGPTVDNFNAVTVP